MTEPADRLETFTQSMSKPVEDTYCSVSKLSGEVQAVEAEKTKSHGSCPPFGAVQSLWIRAAPPVELDSHEDTVLETSIGKFAFVPDATVFVDVTVIER